MLLNVNFTVFFKVLWILQLVFLQIVNKQNIMWYYMYAMSLGSFINLLSNSLDNWYVTISDLVVDLLMVINSLSCVFGLDTRLWGAIVHETPESSLISTRFTTSCTVDEEDFIPDTNVGGEESSCLPYS